MSKKRNYNIPKRFFHRIEEPLKDEIKINIKLLERNEQLIYQKSNGRLNCMYTTEPIEHYPIGIPVLEFKTDKEIIYHCVDVFSTFEAAYTELNNRLMVGNKEIYSNSEKLLLNLFNELYPGEELHKLPSKHLLKIFNGNLTYDEYLKNAHKMVNNSSKYKFIHLPHTIEQISDKKSIGKIEWL